MSDDYSHHLTQVESLMKQIRELCPAKSRDVMFLAERAIAHLWEIRDAAELGYPVQEQAVFMPHEQVQNVKYPPI